MTETLGIIKFVDLDRIITTKDGVTQTWSRFAGNSNHFIVWSGVVYKLLKIA